MRRRTGLLLLALAAGFVSAGCIKVERPPAIVPRYPLIPLPPSPDVRDVAPQELACLSRTTYESVIHDLDELVAYSERLRRSVAVYNEFARKSNEEQGYYEEEKKE